MENMKISFEEHLDVKFNVVDKKLNEIKDDFKLIKDDIKLIRKNNLKHILYITFGYSSSLIVLITVLKILGM